MLKGLKIPGTSSVDLGKSVMQLDILFDASKGLDNRFKFEAVMQFVILLNALRMKK